MKRTNTIHLNEAWILFFLLGVIMLNFPFLHIFNRITPIFGFPLLVLYLLVGWPISIIVIYLFSRSLASSPEDESKEP